MTPLLRQRLVSWRLGSRALLASALLATLLPTTSALAAPGGRPDFKLPFKCGEKWRLSTYRGHAPDDKKLVYLKRWGNDEARDNNGQEIPNC
jgi:hypothetical protein